MQRQKIHDRSEFLLDNFSFSQYREWKVSGLSGGTQQKLSLALALLHQPDLLILDEPYNGFDWDTYLRFWGLANKLRSEGCTILIVTHMIADQQPFDKIWNLESGYLS
jgi:ABC-type multidrug transport system ATPase subunit